MTCHDASLSEAKECQSAQQSPKRVGGRRRYRVRKRRTPRSKIVVASQARGVHMRIPHERGGDLRLPVDLSPLSGLVLPNTVIPGPVGPRVPGGGESGEVAEVERDSM